MLNNLIASVVTKYAELKTREEGQGLVEYALILVLISLVAIVVMGTIGDDIIDVFDGADSALDGVAGS